MRVFCADIGFVVAAVVVVAGGATLAGAGLETAAGADVAVSALAGTAQAKAISAARQRHILFMEDSWWDGDS